MPIRAPCRPSAPPLCQSPRGPRNEAGLGPGTDRYQLPRISTQLIMAVGAGAERCGTGSRGLLLSDRGCCLLGRAGIPLPPQPMKMPLLHLWAQERSSGGRAKGTTPGAE